MSDGWVTFGAALGGALVGGLVSTIGAVFNSRRELTVTSRIALYRDYVPELRRIALGLQTENQNVRPWATESLVPIRDALDRTTTLAGRRDRPWARRVRAEINRAVLLEVQAQTKSVTAEPQEKMELVQELATSQYVVATSLAGISIEWEKWLTKRVR